MTRRLGQIMYTPWGVQQMFPGQVRTPYEYGGVTVPPPTPTAPAPSFGPAIPAPPTATVPTITASSDVVRAQELGRQAAAEFARLASDSAARIGAEVTRIPGLLRPWMSRADQDYLVGVAGGAPPASGAAGESEYLAFPFNPNPYALVRGGILSVLRSPEVAMAIRRGEVALARQLTNEAFNLATGPAINEEQARAAAAQAIYGRYKTQLDALPSQQAGGSPTRPVTHPDYQRVWDAFHAELPRGTRGGAIPPSSLLTNLTYPVRAKIEDMMAGRAQAVYDAAAPWRAVLDSVPWPHDFFRSFVRYPLAEPGVFVANIAIWDWEGLMEARYFGAPRATMERDLASWLIANTGALEKHFIAEVMAWAKREEKKQKREAELFGVLDILLKIFGVAASILLPGIGSIISSVMSGAFQYFSKQKMGESQIAMMRKAQAVTNISDTALDRFSVWIAGHAAGTAGGYVVWVEGREVGRADTADQAAQLALANSRSGNRIEIFSSTGQSSGLMLRTDAGISVVPPQYEQQIRGLSTQELTGRVTQATMEVPSAGGVSWAGMLIPLVLLLGSKS